MGSQGRSPQRGPQRPAWPTLLEGNLDGQPQPPWMLLLPAELWGHGPGSPLPLGSVQHPLSSLLATLQRLSPWSCCRDFTVQTPSLSVCGWSPGLRGSSPLHTCPCQLFPPPPVASGDTTNHGFRAAEAKAHHPSHPRSPGVPDSGTLGGTDAGMEQSEGVGRPHHLPRFLTHPPRCPLPARPAELGGKLTPLRLRVQCTHSGSSNGPRRE